MSKEKEYAEFSAECIAETPQALLVIIDGEKHWVPKSVISDDSAVQGRDDTGTLIVKTWFAEKVGLE